MKKYIIFLAAALMFAACAKEEVNVTGETEFITVELNAATKTQLDGLNTKWSAGDAVSVNINGESIGTLTLVEGSTFSGNITKGKSGKATLTYPAGVTSVPTTQTAVAGSFANGSALLEGDTTIEDLRAGNGATLDNKTALLQFTVAQAGDVKFTVGSTEYTVTGCTSGNTYYACVAPVTNKSLSYTSAGKDGANSKSSVTFEATKVYNLGVLAPMVYIYVKNDMGWSDVNIYGFEKANDKNLFTNAWPGTKMTATEDLNGTSFLKIQLPANFVNKEIGLVFNNGTKQLSDYVATIIADTHLRLTPGTPLVVNPQDKSSFKYRIYVYDQAAKKDVKIHYWGEGFESTKWPGTQITNYVDYDYKSLGYYEIPSAAYSGKTFYYLLNVNGDELKTSDLSVLNPTSDLFIGYWNNNGGKGFWMNNSNPFTNADSCN